MCFSATASFSAGVVLSAIGVAAIKKVDHPSQLLFASIPLLFAVQQITEGVLWLILPNAHFSIMQKDLTYLFLFFAQVLWPLWVPAAIMLLEKEEKRKNIQKILVGIGAMVSLYFVYCLFAYNVQAKIIGYHVWYKQDYSSTIALYVGALYIIATVTPQFFSHIKRMWVFGVAILISYIVSAIFYDRYVVSVWCFFASIISISVYLIMLEISNLNKVGIQAFKPKNIVGYFKKYFAMLIVLLIFATLASCMVMVRSPRHTIQVERHDGMGHGNHHHRR